MDAQDVGDTVKPKAGFDTNRGLTNANKGNAMEIGMNDVASF